MARVRRHGCEAPLHPSQIAVVGVGLLSAVVFYFFSVQELPVLMQRTVVPLYSAQFSLTALLFAIISRFDPEPPRPQADDAHISVSIASAPVKGSGLLASHPVAATCRDCGRLALTPDTRHCGTCNKCIPGYDHHCIYLNTCIGTRNYPLFVGLLSCSILLLLTQQVVTGYAISRLLAPRQDQENNTRAVVLCVLSVLPMLELFFLVVLGLFHVYIAYQGLTTYEWLYQWLERRHPERTTVDSSSTVAE
ncbi:putative S-acyltransferase [Phytophthora megakarya]|uniref:Palmitoyltransferase n=1 Tax=Phytophthora megakarya TaxID=4795 RepID=A0A225X1A5_9STRA|nr:putative S-acyltransferase [Phytophthora megakarya]